jgi:hypothetical protein
MEISDCKSKRYALNYLAQPCSSNSIIKHRNNQQYATVRTSIELKTYWRNAVPLVYRYYHYCTAYTERGISLRSDTQFTVRGL